jgi:hypothetical protein
MILYYMIYFQHTQLQRLVLFLLLFEMGRYVKIDAISKFSLFYVHSLWVGSFSTFCLSMFGHSTFSLWMFSFYVHSFYIQPFDVVIWRSIFRRSASESIKQTKNAWKQSTILSFTIGLHFLCASKKVNNHPVWKNKILFLLYGTLYIEDRLEKESQHS